MAERDIAWAVFPARGGSKSLPMKNIFPLAETPLIAYGLSAASGAATISRRIVSTDSSRIADVARTWGAEIHDRPTHLGGDEVTITAVLKDVIERYRQDQELPEFIATMYPTSPFVTPETIDQCVRLLVEHPEADSAQTLTPVTHIHHATNQKVIEDGRVEFVFPELRYAAGRKQDKRQHFSFANLLVTRVSSLSNEDPDFPDAPLFGGTAMAGPLVNRYEALDVDGPEDFHQAEIYIAAGEVAKPPRAPAPIPSVQHDAVPDMVAHVKISG